ncbi:MULTISPECIES: SOS response-associated peptidase [Chryseobacterium group]|uniref:SOS response-associated peptidase n=1 Tax=Chryseobacterium group TaxID=2782232 RepID=UPI002899F732|nr:SOS response-associated peptidase family protein [Epilithonimonas sp.]
MCYRFSTLYTAKEAEQYYNAYEIEEGYYTVDELNGFNYPETAIIMDIAPTEIVVGKWGLFPSWAKEDFQKKTNTLNAKVETIPQLASYKNSVNKRCVIPAKHFYEWQWLDEKGKTKKKFKIKIKDQELFSLAGIYNLWTHPTTGKQLKTYSIVTTAANDLMSIIHNNKKRMPICLNKDLHKLWLDQKPLEMFSYPNLDPELVAVEAEETFADTLFPEVNSK